MSALSCKNRLSTKNTKSTKVFNGFCLVVELFRAFASFRPMAKCLLTPFRGPIAFFRFDSA